MVVALIIAVVGVLLRKVKWKKPRKKSKNEYDRNKTVSKQVSQRKASMVREEKLRELNKELEELNAERTKFEEDYKHDMTLLREMKIKRESQTEINKLNKEMKKNQKLASNLGVTISRLESEIEYVKSETYLNALAKKLENEQKQEDDKTSNDDNKKSNENKKETK